jgi:hypothetical protein
MVCWLWLDKKMKFEQKKRLKLQKIFGAMSGIEIWPPKRGFFKDPETFWSSGPLL